MFSGSPQKILQDKLVCLSISWLVLPQRAYLRTRVSLFWKLFIPDIFQGLNISKQFSGKHKTIKIVTIQFYAITSFPNQNSIYIVCMQAPPCLHTVISRPHITRDIIIHAPACTYVHIYIYIYIYREILKVNQLSFIVTNCFIIIVTKTTLTLNAF